ncbi:siderophore-interacting protein [Pyxidicoccus fallax]|uniref:Siderophore-interacting protein n=1 Tax=Pyxidicoccus fallax TaxID=394095 RepID=A0A848L8W2_9BACT|nr:siderophore-interacting protein [Pyxidicoccus fallax]NMO15034.1 siderophore-interacting protein [Pyxidicoccus fallax]NPC78056.1 siderophore-interacting protein [Pyxidicoccus fallax]
MTSGKAIIGGVLGRFLFRDARVEQVREVSAHFRWLELVGEGLKDASWSAGDKVQVFLPGEGMRTYTPLAWDAVRGATQFLVYLHGDGPGARWGRSVRVGDRCQLFGPRGSVPLAAYEGPVVLFGDETSFAVGHALRNLRAGIGGVEQVFEVSSRPESTDVLREFGLAQSDVVERTAGDGHLPEVAARLQAALQRRPGARLVMTGRAQAIQALRGRLKAAGVEPAQKVKAYWSLGKAGLD